VSLVRSAFWLWDGSDLRQPRGEGVHGVLRREGKRREVMRMKKMGSDRDKKGEEEKEVEQVRSS
jgi:hypothetical protein